MVVTDFNHSLVISSTFLMPFAFTLTNNQEEAKDLYQETIFRALVHKEKFRFDTNIKAWLYTIMRNEFINGYRKKSRHYTVVSDTTNSFSINALKTTTANEAITSISTKEIQQKITNLPDVLKHPFALYFSGFKYNEIAYTLGEPIGTIKSRIFFARKLLKAQIERF